MTLVPADPRLPSLLLLLAGLLFLAAGSLLALPRQAWGRLQSMLRAVPRGVALVAGGSAGVLLVLLGRALDVRGLRELLWMLLAVLVALIIGLYLPGLEARQHSARRKRLEWQTVDLAGHLLQALRGQEGEVGVLRAYTHRPRPAVCEMQQLIAATLEAHLSAGRGSVLDQLYTSAEESGCRPLIEVCDTVRQVARQDRRQVVQALAQQRGRLLERTLASAKVRAQRMEFVILGVTAGSLMFGLLLFILYVMTGGGTLLGLS